MAERELKAIVDPLIDENTTYGLVESDDEYESEEIEEIIETEQAEAHDRAERLEKFERLNVLLRIGKRIKWVIIGQLKPMRSVWICAEVDWQKLCVR